MMHMWLNDLSIETIQSVGKRGVCMGQVQARPGAEASILYFQARE